jgi:hypothetical protein
MRFCNRLAAGVCLSFFAVALFAQSSQQSDQSSPPSAPPPTQQAEQTTSSDQPSPAPKGPVAPLVLHDLAPDAHTPTPAELAAQKSARIQMQISRLASLQANWGKSESAPGMSLTLKEIARKETPTGTEISYHLVGTGFTPDMQLTLLRWPLDKPIEQVMSGIAVNADGTADCGVAAPGPAAPTDAHPTPATPASTSGPHSCTTIMKAGAPITITTTAARGQAIRVALVSSDHKHGASGSVVPFPIQSQNNGCRLSVILGSKNADLVLIEGDGFKQDKTFTLGSESYGKKNGIHAAISPDGHFVTALLPLIPGHEQGNTVVYYQSSTCTPTVSFNWGAGSYKVQ